MKNKTLLVTALLLIVSINSVRMILSSNIRAVEFVSIFVMGALAGIWLMEVVKLIKRKGQTHP